MIAAVNGATVGGGFELALSADIILAAEHAEFWLPEMERGFLASAGAIQRLPRRIPYNVAMELFLTGRRMGAEEGQALGAGERGAPRERPDGAGSGSRRAALRRRPACDPGAEGHHAGR